MFINTFIPIYRQTLQFRGISILNKTLTLSMLGLYMTLLLCYVILQIVGPSWPWSYDSWIYNYLCNQCLSPLVLWVWISIRARCTTLCDKVCQGLATVCGFLPGPPVSFTNKTECHDITEILLKEALNTIKQTTKNCHHYNLISRKFIQT